MSPEPHRVLQVDPEACAEVIEAAFGVLREMALRDRSDDAPARLAELMRARRSLLDARGGADRP